MSRFGNIAECEVRDCNEDYEISTTGLDVADGMADTATAPETAALTTAVTAPRVTAAGTSTNAEATKPVPQPATKQKRRISSAASNKRAAQDAMRAMKKTRPKK